MDIELLNWVFTTIHLGDFDWLTNIVKVLTYFGDSKVGIGYMVIALILIIPKKTRWLGLTVALSIALDFLLVNITIKNLVARPRPWLDAEAVFNHESLFGILGAEVEPSEYSFPSGHTAVTFAISIALACRYKWKALPAIIIACIVALSRIYLCVHYPSDVVAGIIVGSTCGVVAYFAIKAVEKRVKNKKAIIE